MVGADQLWDIIDKVKVERVAEKAIDLLSSVWSNLADKILDKRKEIRVSYIQNCFDRLNTLSSQK